MAGKKAKKNMKVSSAKEKLKRPLLPVPLKTNAPIQEQGSRSTSNSSRTNTAPSSPPPTTRARSLPARSTQPSSPAQMTRARSPRARSTGRSPPPQSPPAQSLPARSPARSTRARNPASSPPAPSHTDTAPTSTPPTDPILVPISGPPPAPVSTSSPPAPATTSSPPAQVSTSSPPAPTSTTSPPAPVSNTSTPAPVPARSPASFSTPSSDGPVSTTRQNSPTPALVRLKKSAVRRSPRKRTLCRKTCTSHQEDDGQHVSQPSRASSSQVDPPPIITEAEEAAFEMEMDGIADGLAETNAEDEHGSSQGRGYALPRQRGPAHTRKTVTIFENM